MRRQPPDVSVVIGAYDAMPYLTRCMESAVAQSIGHDRMEIIAIDDGATDGTGPELDRFAERYPRLITVVHQENSGGPAAPRNLGLDLATGRYVFFLDADDHLGPEAMERLVGAAESNGSDVVLGRVAGVGGRHAPRSMFRRSEPRTDVFASRVYWTLNPMKLFRRALVEDLGLRFRTDLTVGEDQPFTATAYLNARAISVVADYDCVYWVARDDGGNITRRVRATDARLRVLAAMFELLAKETVPGPGRDHLLHRHFTVDLRKALVRLAEEPERAGQEAAFETLRLLISPWYGQGVASRLPAADRLHCELVGRGLLDELLAVVAWEQARDGAGAGGEPLTTVVEDGRVYARYPYFRDPRYGLPDAAYDITAELRPRHRLSALGAGEDGGVRLAGHAYLRRVDTTEVGTRLVLRERRSAAELVLPVTHTPTPGLDEDHDPGDGCDYGHAGFEAVLDPARAGADGGPLPDGLWDVFVEAGARGVTRTVRFGRHRAPEVPGGPVSHVVRVARADGTDACGADAARVVTRYFTTPHGNLTLDVGERKHPLAERFSVDGVGWAAEGAPVLAVTGRCAVTGLPPGALTLRAVPDRRTGGAVREGPAQVAEDGRFAGRLTFADAERGVWRVELRLAVAGRVWTVPVPGGSGDPDAPALATGRWRRRGLPWYAKPLRRGEQLTFRVTRVSLTAALRRRLRRR
ncbi:glycosyltransferase [Streptomyces armeniacus]|uniref:Glycosyltransferase n=1 Tax=Streptomyces armeniacus TaxID=83291 RepID=A0A345XYW5_9ACTN|nr:glycosyltransferase [Streptomyces armeniacus]AXK36831.1 glycosyltransferase [Streptomyces armeniacus]